MLISHKHRFIFIHIYKTAGSSVRTALRPFIFYSELQLPILRMFRRIGIRPPLILNPMPFEDSHNSAAEAVKVIGQKVFDKYFSFAFVRNPWDWQVSYYNFHVKWTPRTPNPWIDQIKSFPDFTAYIRWRCANPELQKDFIYSADEKLLVNFVGRYENINEDFQTICNRIGIRAELPMANVSKTKPYQEYYAPETVELVRKTFAADIRLFGYDFE